MKTMVPEYFRVTRVRRETADTFTLSLEPKNGRGEFHFAAGQFNMLYVMGKGEVPISISGNPLEPAPLIHTIRAVGEATQALVGLEPGATVGVRGPFGSAWPVEEAEGKDVVIVAGGIGLAPLRPALYQILARREMYGQVAICYGARTPKELLYPGELKKWRSRFDLFVALTVDNADVSWKGSVGVVTRMISRPDFDPLHTVALVCGPEIMMKYSVEALMERGLEADDIFMSMERNMKCAVGFCGHCQFGKEFICKDGPVFPFSRIETAFRTREL
jgi:NAD(P)H-flavin reductase